MTKANVYMGLDFETTGLDSLRHVPLTLGIAWRPFKGEDITSHEFTFNFPHTRKWDIEEMAVNKLQISSYSIFTSRDTFVPPIDADQYDWEICQFLLKQGFSPFDKNIVPVGWNVGGFDMRFMQTFFPQASKFFSYRYMELNSLAYACEIAVPDAGDKSIRDLCEEYAESKTDPPNWNNAEWDAIASIHAFEFMQARLEA